MAVMEPPADPGGSDARKQAVAEVGGEIEVARPWEGRR
jgi:hypothetical protein